MVGSGGKKKKIKLTKDTTKEKEKTILYVYYRFPKGVYIYTVSKICYKWEKIAIFWIWSKVLLLLLLVFNRFFDESFGNFCGLFVFAFFVENLVLPPSKLPVHIIYT